MAECYHWEALRKQRVIDRAAEAKMRVEEKSVNGKERSSTQKRTYPRAIAFYPIVVCA